MARSSTDSFSQVVFLVSSRSWGGAAAGRRFARSTAFFCAEGEHLPAAKGGALYNCLSPSGDVRMLRHYRTRALILVPFITLATQACGRRDSGRTAAMDSALADSAAVYEQ